jgi:ATP-dependent DNA helicase PIF1
MTLDAARIDLRKAFVEGMGYVALSRVKNVNNLYLTGINQMALRVSEEAMSIDENLRLKASEAKKRFAHLIKKADDRATSPVPEAKTGSTWSDKIEKMRETYPNAYRPWTDAQDDELKQYFQQGESVSQLSKRLGRHEGSITIRLQKHFGEDSVELS